MLLAIQCFWAVAWKKFLQKWFIHRQLWDGAHIGTLSYEPSLGNGFLSKLAFLPVPMEFWALQKDLHKLTHPKLIFLTWNWPFLLLFWYVAHIRQLQKTTSSLRHSNSEGWLSRQLPSSSLWMVELFSGTSQAQKFSIMLANLINFNIQVLLGIQTSHLCFQAFAKVLNRSSVLSSIHLEKSTADAMHKHYMQEIKTPKGDLASPWSNLQRLVLMQWWYQRCI